MSLAPSLRVFLDVIEILESDDTFLNLRPHGEPQLGRRGLYRAAGGAVESDDDERALLWVLNLCDGRASLADVADRSRLPYPVIVRAAERLQRAGLLALAGTPPHDRARLDLAAK